MNIYLLIRKILFLLFFLLLFSCSHGNKEIVAEVNGESILMSDLSEVSKQELFDLLNMAYEIKLKILNDLIKRKLLDVEAKKHNLTTEKYLEKYLDMIIGANRDSLLVHYGLAETQVNVLKGHVYSSSEQEIEGALALKNKLRSTIIQQLVDSLYLKANIKKYIFPPKQPKCVIADLCTHYKGNLSSSVSLIVASDFTCERCAAFEKTLRLIFEKYKDRVKFGFVSFGDNPSLPALACEAASRQNKFWEFHDAIFAQTGVIDSTYIFNFAKKENLDVQQFKQDLLSQENYSKLDRTINDLVSRGLFATPTIVVNDRLVYMTNSYEELSKLLEYELNQ